MKKNYEKVFASSIEDAYRIQERVKKIYRNSDLEMKMSIDEFKDLGKLIRIEYWYVSED